MQILLKWVNELVNIKTASLDDLIKKLTLGGFEVEEILEVEINNQKQIILDISATANRSDSLSIQGISAEISALLDQPQKISKYSVLIDSWKETFITKNILVDPDCSIFLTMIVKNLTNINIPTWIKQKLISSGLTTLNNLLDFQNYILLETGYPFVFYDFDKITSKINNSKFSLSILKAIKNQNFFANNGENYYLNENFSVINADKTPISIAGIIENQNFSYSATTTSVLIEGSIFNASKIRQQSRNLGLRTDRSARYEKSLKSTYIIEALYKLICLLRVSNPNMVCHLHTMAQTIEQTSKLILLNYETTNEILGPIQNSNKNEIDFIYLTPKMISSYLNRLNFNYSYDQDKLIWEVEIPHSRIDDITREIDLIEEIGRLHGFNNFLITLPKIKTIGIEDLSSKIRRKITSCFLNLGLNELIHYSLVNETKNHEIKLINPLIEDYSSLRTTLLPNLIKTVKDNLKQGNLFVEGFEYGHVFCSDEKMIFKEKEYIAGIFGGIKTRLIWSGSEIVLNWFEAKGKIEKLFKQLNLLTYWQSYSDDSMNNIIHPYRSAKLSVSNGNSLGIFGQIHPILANRLNLPLEIYLFEFNMELIQNQLQTNKLPVYKEYSTYPKIIKDLSFIVQRKITFKDLKEILYSNGTEFLLEINLLDEYRGQSIPNQHTSLCFQLIFKSNEKTLQNKEIEDIISNLQLVLIKKFDIILRE